MTDVSSVKAHADPQPASVALFAGPPPPALTNGSPALSGTIDEEESSTIKCICGFSDDDGNTVLCEKCDTWQHIVCYYESAHHVPEVHECTDCLPRAVDSKGAADKQRQRRELHSIGERKGRPRTTTKSHKKRVKDPLGSVQPNGWAVHSNSDLHYNPERKSGSPRDQPPPNKRPKTSHRASGSISQAPALFPGSRKRGASVMLNGHSPVKSPTSPDGPIEEFSLEFMNLYRQQYDSPTAPTDAPNTYLNIAVANDMHLWHKDREALAEATGGKGPADVFVRITDTVKDLEDSVGPDIVHRTEEDTTIKAHGLHPQWQFVTTETPIAEGGFIGELKGRIGRRQDYIADPENRWTLLRHPEPFIFFPPYLPIYLDSRNEGSKLRFARRSCAPNMTMKIFVENEQVDRFCFVATREINPGEELTIGWDIDAEIQKQLSKVANGEKEAFRKLQPWAACILANFGGCACDTSTGHECLLDRLRRNNNADVEPVQLPKSTKGRKKKSQISPLSTGRATNSRAGSEAFLHDANEDEIMDSRSTSGSHKSSSRDITPATHFSVDGGDLKMSDRERRKLLQQERLFEQLEYDAQHKGRGRKRNSAGSTLNTPSLSSSKQLGHPEPSPSARHPREHSHGVARKTSGNSTKTNGRTAPKPKPVYVDNSTQTEDDKTSASIPAFPAKARVMKPPVSFKRKLLQQAQEDKLQRERIRSTSVKMESKSPALKDVSSSKPSPVAPTPVLEEPTAMDISTETVPETKPEEPTPAKEPAPAPSADVEMKDADEATTPKPPEPKVEEMPDAPKQETSSDTSNPPAQPPPPPWSSSIPAQPAPVSPDAPPQKPTDLHMEIPKPDMTNPTASTNSVVTPGSVSSVVTSSAIAQSPISAAPAPSPFSPSVTNAVNPGPTRKKLSLSDYTSRRKLAQSHSTGSNSTPTQANSQSTSSPTMSNSSLPNQTSPSSKSVEPALPTVTEESKPQQPSTATTSTPTST